MNKEEITEEYLREMEKTINDTFPGLNMYVRDVNLNPELEKKYYKNQIIKEKAYTDASYRVMGMATTHRYSILSNHMTDFSMYENDTNWGLCIAARDSHFLVLDIYEYNNKTQILLLHLPDDERWKMFKNVEINIINQLIDDSRKRFENKCNLNPIPELTTKDWLKRCSFPLGMDDNGNLFELE